MIDEVPRRPQTAEDGLTSADIGALAQRFRSEPGWVGVVLWWTTLVGLVATCAWPHPAAVSVVWVYVAVVFWRREVRRRAFLRNLAEQPCFSRNADVEPPEVWPNVMVVVPARNEEVDLEQAARSLAALRYPNLDIWYVNDHSTDRTPQILEALQRDHPHIRVLHDPPVMEGWFGKSSAIWHAVLEIDREHEKRLAGSDLKQDRGWWLFADADVIFEPEILDQAVALVERERLDFLTCMPHLMARTWAEQFLLPSGWRGIIQGADYRRMNDPKSFPIGIGAFMLVRDTAYRACGGHRALAQWHPEDTLLAAAAKHVGGRVGFAWTPDLLRVRLYHGYREVKRHTIRKMRIFFGDYFQLPLSMMALRLSTSLMSLPMMAVGIGPQLAAGRFDPILTALAAAGLVLYVDEAREYKGVEQIAEFHPAVPWLHPVTNTLRVWFALSYIGQIVGKHPMEWRGRREFGATGTTPSAPVQDPRG